MFGPQLLNPSFNNGFSDGSQRANKFGGINPVVRDGFSSPGNHLGQGKQAGSESPAQAGQVMLARLVTSVESRFSATNIRQIAPTDTATPAETHGEEASLGFLGRFRYQRGWRPS